MNQKGFHHLTWTDRITIEKMLKVGCSKGQIAQAIGVCLKTVYNELKRGTVNGKYDPYYSEARYRDVLECKGPEPILSKGSVWTELIAKWILEKGMSPEAIARRFREDAQLQGGPRSANTIYAAIDAGIIPGVTRDNLQSDITRVYNGGDTIHLAKWVQERFNIKDGDLLHFWVEDDRIVFSKYDEQ